MRRFLCAALAVLLLFLSAGCSGPSAKDAPAVRELFAMDTYMTLTCYGENAEEALDAAEAEIRRLDALLSTGSPDSEVSRLNRDGGGELSEDTLALVKAALAAYEDTGGAFDITVLPLMELWGFPSGELHVPSGEELAQALAVTGSGRLSLDGSVLSLEPGTQIDLGGIAKGYASALLMDLFRSFGVEHAIVSLGGNVQCLGAKPDGSLWRCGIRDPEAEKADELAGILTVRDTAVITSGPYERKLTDPDTGQAYHHILDPSTGRPADTGLASVTIVSGDGALADALSTACFVMGPEKAEAFWRERSDAFDMILVLTGGGMLVTEGIADEFSSSRSFSVIRK